MDGRRDDGNTDKKERKSKLKCELYRDSMQNYKRYGIPHAQLVIADIPFNLGQSFFANRPDWYIGSDNKNGESKNARSAAFDTDYNFNVYEMLHFASRMLKKEPKKSNGHGVSSDAPCMIVFCAFDQTHDLIKAAAKHGFMKYTFLVFTKNYSPSVLKANMKIVEACEYGLLFYRDKLPKFRNGVKQDVNGKNIRGTGNMVFNHFEYRKDGNEYPVLHKTQKPVGLLKQLIEICTDPGDVVIDPCFGSGSTARACIETGRNFYGFEINKEFYRRAKNEMCNIDHVYDADGIVGQMSITDLIKG